MLFQPLARSTAIESVSSAFLTATSSMMNNSRMTSPVQSEKAQASSKYIFKHDIKPIRNIYTIYRVLALSFLLFVQNLKHINYSDLSQNTICCT